MHLLSREMRRRALSPYGRLAVRLVNVSGPATEGRAGADRACAGVLGGWGGGWGVSVCGGVGVGLLGSPHVELVACGIPVFSKFRSGFLSVPFSNPARRHSNCRGGIADFQRPHPPLTSLIESQLVFAPLRIEISSYRFNHVRRMVNSAVKILRPQTDNSNFLIAFRDVARLLSP